LNVRHQLLFTSALETRRSLFSIQFSCTLASGGRKSGPTAQPATEKDRQRNESNDAPDLKPAAGRTRLISSPHGSCLQTAGISNQPSFPGFFNVNSTPELLFGSHALLEGAFHFYFVTAMDFLNSARL
jgi:hypothetical protein